LTQLCVYIQSEFDGSILEPGSSISVPFTVTINGTGGQFTILATNDQGLVSTFPTLLVLANDSSANGTVTLTAPPSTPTGTAVTLTIQAQSPGGTDTNYVVLRMSIVATVIHNFGWLYILFIGWITLHVRLHVSHMQ